ncbi:MAG TPA: hypothetical protein VKI64_00550 [Acidimicrobiales bacterium]|nr:hypothetical protein [Acidimicrobiales bacterium]
MGGPLPAHRLTALLLEPDREVRQHIGQHGQRRPTPEVHVGAARGGVRGGAVGHSHVRPRHVQVSEVGEVGQGHHHRAGRAPPESRDHGQATGGQVGVDDRDIGLDLGGHSQGPVAVGSSPDHREP